MLLVLFCTDLEDTCPEITDEDCLYLNVFTPSTDKLVEKQPVMVFIHGGHFDQGGAGVYIVSSQKSHFP